MFTFLKDIQCLQTNHVLASCQQARTEELCSSLFATELEYYGAQTQTETESETEQTEMHVSDTYIVGICRLNLT